MRKHDETKKKIYRPWWLQGGAPPYEKDAMPKFNGIFVKKNVAFSRDNK